jgi:hypothetical protein
MGRRLDQPDPGDDLAHAVSIGFVVFATALDVLTAQALDRTTGKTMPVGA